VSIKILKCRAGKKLEKISLSDHSRNKEVLHRVREERSILHNIKKEEFYLDWSHLP